jgi:hypothetical protein
VGVSRVAEPQQQSTVCNYAPALPGREPVCTIRQREGVKPLAATAVASCMNTPIASTSTSMEKRPGVAGPPIGSPTTSDHAAGSPPVSSVSRATTRSKRRGLTRRGEHSLPNSETLNRSSPGSPGSPQPGPSTSNANSSAFYSVVSRTTKHSVRLDPGSPKAAETSSSGEEIIPNLSPDAVQINEISSSSEPVKTTDSADTRGRVVCVLRTRKGVKDPPPEPPQKKRKIGLESLNPASPTKPNTRNSTSPSKVMIPVSEEKESTKERLKRMVESVNVSENAAQAKQSRKSRNRSSEKLQSDNAEEVETDVNKPADLAKATESSENVKKSTSWVPIKKNKTGGKKNAKKEKKVLSVRTQFNLL